jgi:hypothetical protein
MQMSWQMPLFATTSQLISAIGAAIETTTYERGHDQTTQSVDIFSQFPLRETSSRPVEESVQRPSQDLFGPHPHKKHLGWFFKMNKTSTKFRGMI